MVAAQDDRAHQPQPSAADPDEDGRSQDDELFPYCSLALVGALS